MGVLAAPPASHNLRRQVRFAWPEALSKLERFGDCHPLNTTIQFVLQHGYTVLFLWVLAEQAGLPVPSLPILLAAGALAALGKLAFPLVMVYAVVACLIADFSWFAVGRAKGFRVLNWMCRISLEPDSCVRRTKDIYTRDGSRSLLVAKFVPGFSTLADAGLAIPDL